MPLIYQVILKENNAPGHKTYAYLVIEEIEKKDSFHWSTTCFLEHSHNMLDNRTSGFKEI